jgi:hypothetical protein
MKMAKETLTHDGDTNTSTQNQYRLLDLTTLSGYTKYTHGYTQYYCFNGNCLAAYNTTSIP